MSTEDHKPGFRSPSSSTCSSDLNQDIDSQARAELSRRSMDSQSSFASSTSDLTVGKSGIMINGSGFPPLEIKDPWSVVHVATVVNPSLIYVSIIIAVCCISLFTLLLFQLLLAIVVRATKWWRAALSHNLNSVKIHTLLLINGTCGCSKKNGALVDNSNSQSIIK